MTEKEIGKLLGLLNEYEKVREKSEYQKLSNKEYKWFSSYYFPLCFGHQENFSGAMTNEFGEGTEDIICSKKFGFIKWLVDNDKINPLRKFIGWETDEDEPYIQFDLVDQYIAYLSIQDEPINFLISILK